MLGLKLMLLVTHRECSEEFIEFFSKNKIERVFSKLCRGTATSAMLDILGLESTEKVMFEAVVRENQIPELKKNLIMKMNMETSGNGIAIFMPIDGIGGERALKYLVGEAPVEKSEENK
ncbi:MAG: P-II family nitrogen regulator, partial [Clostridia bacterium]|nr:P-II family nitrogen regulator [Clostridia bacterium]